MTITPLALRFQVVAIVALAAGCEPRAATKPAQPSVAAVEGAVPAAAAPPAPSPSEVLDGLDARAPVPLLPMMANHQKQNMRDHLLAVQEIVLALASDDFAGVEKAATRIGFSEQMGQMCTHMGAGAQGFTEQALSFHHTADGIAGAARERDRKGVLRELAATLATCTGCHASWKQRVVDDATWQSVTGTAAPSQGEPLPAHGDHGHGHGQ